MPSRGRAQLKACVGGGSSPIFQHNPCSCMAVAAIGQEDVRRIRPSPQQDASSLGNLGEPGGLHPRRRSCSNYCFE